MPGILERQLHYAAKDSDNFLDAAQNARLIASAERYYRVMYFGARNLGSAAYPYVRHARPHPGFQPLLIFPAAFCWDPEAQADLRCGLAAAFLAGASLDFLPYRGVVAQDQTGRGYHCSHGMGEKLHDDEADHGITKPCHHPGQGDREQEKRRLSDLKARTRSAEVAAEYATCTPINQVILPQVPETDHDGVSHPINPQGM